MPDIYFFVNYCYRKKIIINMVDVPKNMHTSILISNLLYLIFVLSNNPAYVESVNNWLNNCSLLILNYTNMSIKKTWRHPLVKAFGTLREVVMPLHMHRKLSRMYLNYVKTLWHHESADCVTATCIMTQACGGQRKRLQPSNKQPAEKSPPAIALTLMWALM